MFNISILLTGFSPFNACLSMNPVSAHYSSLASSVDVNNCPFVISHHNDWGKCAMGMAIKPSLTLIFEEVLKCRKCPFPSPNTSAVVEQNKENVDFNAMPIKWAVPLWWRRHGSCWSALKCSNKSLFGVLSQVHNASSCNITKQR